MLKTLLAFGALVAAIAAPSPSHAGQHMDANAPAGNLARSADRELCELEEDVGVVVGPGEAERAAAESR